MYIRDDLIKAKAGDTKSKEALIEQYTPLLKSTIKKIYINSYTYDDLLQQGKLFILNAIDKFDINKSDKEFSMYVFYTIRNNFNYLCRKNIKSNTDLSLHNTNSKSKEEFINILPINYNVELDYIYKLEIQNIKEKISLLTFNEKDLIYCLYFKEPRDMLSKYCRKRNIPYSQGVRFKKQALDKLR